MRILVPLDLVCPEAVGPCRAAAAEIRATAMMTGADLDDVDRAGLFALAAIIERRGTAAMVGRLGMETAIEQLIGMLDVLDAPDMDREPVLGAPERHPQLSQGFGACRDPGIDQAHWGCGSDDDLERDDADDELSLGWGANVGQIALGANTEDAEPCLGAPENHDEAPDQRCWAQGGEGERGEDEPDWPERLPDGARDANAAATRGALERLDKVIRRKHGFTPWRIGNVVVLVRP